MHRFVPLTRGKFAIVDDEDYSRVIQYRWSYQPISGRETGYILMKASGERLRGKVHMNKFILGITDPSILIHHRNGNTLDCRRVNLRLATHADLVRHQRLSKNNTSGYKGVHHRTSGRYQAYISVNNKRLHLGYYSTAPDAARAYNAAAMQYHGEFALLNEV